MHPMPHDFDRLYRDTFEIVLRVLRRHGVTETCLEDAAQDVFLIAHRRLSTFEGRSSPAAWVYGIARRVAADYRRGAGRRAGREELPPSLDFATDDRASPYQHVLSSEGAAILGHMLAELAPYRRRVFVLAELDGLSGPAIAEELSLPVETVYGRLRKARAEFEAIVARHHANEIWRQEKGRLAPQSGDETRKSRVLAAVSAFLGEGAAPPPPTAAATPGAALAIALPAALAAAACVAIAIASQGGHVGTVPGAARPAEIETRVPAPLPAATIALPPGADDPETGVDLETAAIEGDALEHELRLLSRALAHARAGDRPLALHTLRRHRRRFPDGAMAPEREGLDAMLRCESGQATAEPALADPALLAAVRSSCAGADFDPDD